VSRKILFFREICVTDSIAPAPEAAPDAPVAEAPSRSDLEAKLAAAQAEIARLNDEFLRARAEAENARRRAVDDVARAHRFGIESFAASLLPVRDSLEAALAVEAPTVESLREGVGITHRQLSTAFEKAALAEVFPKGEKFDPHRHQALSQVEADQEPNTIVEVLQKGYLLHDRVIRPALVMVARERSAPATEPPPSA
jgi:molecular chaperone GrpE